MQQLSTGAQRQLKRMRAAATRLAVGSPSMLRLSRGVEARLPTAPALTDWVERVSGMMDLTPLDDAPPAAPRAGSPWGTA